jgi:hypothetical protein
MIGLIGILFRILGSIKMPLSIIYSTGTNTSKSSSSYVARVGTEGLISFFELPPLAEP